MNRAWREALPVLRSHCLTLRELTSNDALPLFTATASEQVNRFITPPPATPEDFARFIQWAECERRAGAFACFGIVPRGFDKPVGLFQIQRRSPGFDKAEWGFVIGSAMWGSGVFLDGARQVIDFAFDTIGVRRLEARAAVDNGRGNGALRKLGAVKEGTVKQTLIRHGERFDQTVWSILNSDWRRSKAVWGPKAA